MSSESDNIPSDLLAAILNDPDKKQIILKLLNQTKSTIKDDDSSKKHKRQYCESPVALFRRRALEKLNANTSDSSSECSTDLEIQPPPPPPGPKVPFKKLLDGVIAFVDVRRDNVNKSAGIKFVMESMGAVVKDKLTKGVTHVVFKDADFITYHAARLLKCHLVSVLWLDAIRKKGYRIPEKNYPAFGGDDANASVLCSQIQREFDDIVKEEKRRSYDVRKISTQQQRRTLITPISSKSSYSTAKSTPKSSTNTDSEIAEILSNIPSTSFIQQSSPEITSDDSDCGVVNGYTSSHLRKKFKRLKTSSSIDTTASSEPSQSLISGRRTIKSPGVQTKIPINEENIPVITKTISPSYSSTRRITRSNSKLKTNKINILNDVILQTPSKISNIEESSDRTQTLSTEQSVNVSSSTRSSSSRSNNRSSRRSCNLKDPNNMIFVQKTSSSLSILDESSDRTKTISTAKSMNVSTNNKSSSNKNSTMSSLRVSSELNGNVDGNEEIQSIMSSLRISSSSKNTNKENSGLLANLNDHNDVNITTKIVDNQVINKIQQNQSKAVIKRRRLFDPEIVYCSPRNDELEREERKRFLEINDKHEQNKNDDELITRKKRKKSTSSNKTDTSLNESSSNSEKQSTSSVRPTSYNSNKIIDNNNNRRSSLEFQNSTETHKKTRIRIDRMKAPSIVCTKFHRSETLEFTNIVKQLGVFQVELQVTKKTTHLIAGESLRTINMLRALARGCWILKREWLHKSLEHGRWLPEEDYELTEFSPAVQQCRLERQAFGPHYTMDVFQTCGKIFVSNNTTPGRDELRELIEICKGDLTNVHRNADIVVGQYVRSPNVICVTETWVLDSVAENKLKSVRKYLIRSLDSPDF